MAKEVERKKKLLQIMKDLTMNEISKQNEIPEVVQDYLLSEYELSNKTDVVVDSKEFLEFENNLENVIRERYDMKHHTKYNEPSSSLHNIDGNCTTKFIKACETFEKAKCDYLRITSQLVSLEREIVQFKEKYSSYIVENSVKKESEFEILQSKLHFLKLQSFLKFYTEKNSFQAHLRLREILSEKLNGLKSCYNNLVELDAKYCEVKNNKPYCDLLETYKQLIKKEKKIEYMMEK